MPSLPGPGPVWATYGILLGLHRDLTGLALAHTNPMVPMVARTNPAWDQAGLAILALLQGPISSILNLLSLSGDVIPVWGRDPSLGM